MTIENKSLITKTFSKKEIEISLKNSQSEKLLSKILTMLMLKEANFIILGPGDVCNLLAKRIAILLPGSER